MPSYNIIYTSPSNEIYLWSGRSLDRLNAKERTVLKYSGKSVKDDDVSEAIKQCREAVQLLFPRDANPQVQKVQLKVSA